MRRTAAHLLIIATLALTAEHARAAASGDVARHRWNRTVRLPHRLRKLATRTPDGYTPQQIRHAYGYDDLAGGLETLGAGRTIGIVVAFGNPHMQHDLNKFSDQFDLPRTHVRVLYPGGRPAGFRSGWALETSLDVEWAHATAPGANLLLVVAKNAKGNRLLDAVDAAVQEGATEVSMSWGSPEFDGEGDLEDSFSRPGIAYVAPAGDDGAGVLWPAASPNVLGVGGTSLQLDDQGNRLSEESAWTDSGGGQSFAFSRPTYQAGFNRTLDRGVPDVALFADVAVNGYVVFMTKPGRRAHWFSVAGTSAGVPQWAGLVAIVNGRRASPLALSGIHTALYSLATGGRLAQYFNDVVSGCSYSSETGDEACAVTGFDLVTGLGSPKVAPLVEGLTSFVGSPSSVFLDEPGPR
jgi:subtilase family serine protease